MKVPLLAKKIGIDFGTSTVLAYVKGEGVVVSEPGLTALDRQRALRRLIVRAQGRARLFRPEVALSVSSARTATDRRAMTEAAIAAGARQAWLIDEPLAAAIGAGLPIAEPRGSAVCVIGSGLTQVAVIAQWSTFAERSISVGGRQIDAALAGWARSRHGLELDAAAAERLKIEIGSACPMEEPLRATVGGVELSSNDVAEAIADPLSRIAGAIRDALADAPPALAADVAGRGIVLSGGGAQLRALDLYVAEQAGIPAVVADEPQTLVVRGTGLALESFEVLKRNQTYLR